MILIIDNFVTFLFYVGRGHHLQKTTSKINNLNRVLQALHVIEYTSVHQAGHVGMLQ